MGKYRNSLQFKLIALLCIVLASLTACANVNNQTRQSTGQSVSSSAASCEKPPQTLEFNRKTYRLKAVNTNLEPGLKSGYMKCENGKFSLGDADSAYTVYSVGDPRTNNEIIFTGNWEGKWGGALYSINAAEK